MLKGLSGMRLYFSCCPFEASQVTRQESVLESNDMHMSTTAWNVCVHNTHCDNYLHLHVSNRKVHFESMCFLMPPILHHTHKLKALISFHMIPTDSTDFFLGSWKTCFCVELCMQLTADKRKYQRCLWRFKWFCLTEFLSGGRYQLEIKIPETYPFNPPKVGSRNYFR